MKAVVQRVTKACVIADGVVTGRIDRGLLVYLGVEDTDTVQICKKMADKILKLRIFQDENGKMNLDLSAAGGQILVVSQFTLYANLKKGNRPSWDLAGKPEHAEQLYEQFIGFCREAGFETGHGKFGADMTVSYSNMGPVTIIVDSDELFK